MHITEYEDLTPERVQRLIIREEIHGVNFAVRFEQSSLILADGEHSVQIKCELEDEAIIDFFEKEAASVLEQYEVDALELDCIQIKGNTDYLFPGPVIILEGATAEKDGNRFYLAPETLPSIGMYFGTIPLPQFNPPTALLLAIQKKQKGVCNKLLKRLRQLPSLYGVADFQPNYYACLGRITSPEERSMRWPI